ncbi:hypothetical protein [Streptomyces sp. NPDC001604]|uniref:SbtR family transcriptional regulator n=1 Tax=Streptomyces sp. NPDC001604 TaxID=3364593 RepID=UPI0036B91ABB
MRQQRRCGRLPPLDRHGARQRELTTARAIRRGVCRTVRARQTKPERADDGPGCTAATDSGTAFFGFFRHLVADATGKIAIGEALQQAGGNDSGDAARASDGLRRAVGALLQQAQRTGAVRDDVELPEVYDCSSPPHEPRHAAASRKGYGTGCWPSPSTALPRHRPRGAGEHRGMRHTGVRTTRQAGGQVGLLGSRPGWT